MSASGSSNLPRRIVKVRCYSGDIGELECCSNHSSVLINTRMEQLNGGSHIKRDKLSYLAFLLVLIVLHMSSLILF